MLWAWRPNTSKGYSLKGYHKPIVAVDGEANTFQLGRDPWHHLTSLCFRYDPGDNRWKSQLLRVLSERGLCPDKAAQVLPAQGAYNLPSWVLPDKAAGRGCQVVPWGGLTSAWEIAGIEPDLPLWGSGLC